MLIHECSHVGLELVVRHHEAISNHLHRCQSKLALDLGLELYRKLLVGRSLAYLAVDVSKHFARQGLRIELEGLFFDVLHDLGVHRGLRVDKGVVRLTPLPEIVELDQLGENEVALINSDRVVEKGEAQT